jgi:hypothetical protein
VSIRTRATSSTRGRRSIRKGLTRSSTWGSLAKRPGHDICDLRAQPRLAEVEQRTRGHSVPAHGRRARLVRGAGPERRCDRPALDHPADGCHDRVRDERDALGLHEVRAERRRPGRSERGGNRVLPAGVLRRRDPVASLWRGLVERRPTPRRWARRPLRLLRLVLDAHALLDGAHRESLVKPSGLRRAAGAHRANLRRLWDEVPRHQRQRPSRPGRAGSPPLGDLGPTSTTTASAPPTSRSPSPTARVST